MYIFPNGETATGMQSFPFIGTILSIILILGLVFINLPYEDQLERKHQLKEKMLREEVLMAEQSGHLSSVLAEEILERPELILQTDIRQNLPFSVQNTYREMTKMKPLDRIDLSNFDFKAVVHGLTNQSLFLFFLCLIFFLIASYYLEHIFHPGVYLALVLFVFSALLFINAESQYTWELPLRSIVPIVSISLWGLVLRMGLKTTMSLSIGILPIKGLSGSLIVPTLMFPILFLVGLFIENALNGTFQYAGNEVKTLFLVVFFFMLIPFLIRTRLKAEILGSEFVIGNSLNRIEGFMNAGELDRARDALKELEVQELTFEQNKSFGELAWKAGLRDMVKASYNRQLLRFDGSDQDKEELLKKMLNMGMKVPGSHYERLFKQTIQQRDLSTFRTLLTFLKDQKETTQKELLIPLREKIKEAIHQKDNLLLDDIKTQIDKIIVFSPLVNRIEQYRQDRLEGASYIDNYAISNKISKRINIDLINIETDVIVMTLPNGTQQRVPWSAVRGLMGVFIHSKLSAVLILEFKKKLFACQFFEDNVKGELLGSNIEQVWSIFNREQPGNLPVTDMKDFDTISQDDVIKSCEEFLQN